MGISTVWQAFFLDTLPTVITEGEMAPKNEGYGKSFYIMKVIYNNRIYRLLAINVRNVQQSLYMGKYNYILKIFKIGDKNEEKFENS